MPRGRTTLFISGFGSGLRAKDLAWEFEEFGPIIRCDIPAPRSTTASPYAFVEFENDRDAEDAFYEMHDKRIDGYRISVQWAKNAPSSSWGRSRRARSPPSRGRRGGRSPPASSSRRSNRDRSYSPRDKRGKSPRRSRSRSRSRTPKSRSPSGSRSRSRSPSRSRTRSRSRTPEETNGRSPSPEKNPAKDDDAKDAKDVKDVKDAKDAKDANDANDADAKDAMDAMDADKS